MKLSINGNIFKVKIQTSPEETQEGMMFKKFDKTFNGMLFVMKNQEHCFWMKNCIVPLDIIFIDGEKINNIQHYCPPCKTKDCKTYDGYGDLVLELPGGTCKKYNINDGDQVEIF